ncbi:MAG TPA: indolepyruvate ferredoxin oxidoreductase family protein [Aestuariivirgaceae bacterium]|jgi:indolepyruvate ferredoxin oxidoreductase
MTRHVTLDDKYDLGVERILVSGTQALVRAALMQHERDRKAGLNTAGYVTGYRGSPLGGLDQQFMRAQKHLEPRNIVFQAGLNEDLAATALWGSQQAEMRGEGRFDGVFGMWYGKGPGVDRCGDVFRHANAAGSSKHGGVLVLMGDDHAAESSTVPHQSEFALLDAMMPILNPAGVQEILDYSLYGFGLSRYSGTWVGIKCVHDNVESTAIIDAGPERAQIALPGDFEMPKGGLSIRAADDRFEQELRLHTYKRFAAVAFARANGLDRIVLQGGAVPKIGVVTAGKSYLDVREALDELGIDEVRAAQLGLRVLKLALVWPVDPIIIEKFAQGLDLIIVVEEKRSLIETHVKEQLYNIKSSPMVIGKRDERDGHLFPAFGTLEPHQIAMEIGERLHGITGDEALARRLEGVRQRRAGAMKLPDLMVRPPYFCAGCPHNTSTVVPEGGRGYAGIGCHWMVQAIPERRTEGSTHMGGEGANWIGEAPFSKRPHVFQNLGDGTYNHSGIMAIRAAIAAGTTMTFKILYNDAVAMTGGQANEGDISVYSIAQEMRAMGVKRLAVISDEPEKYASRAGLPGGTEIHHRDDIMAVQKDMMGVEGVTVLIYDQTCAAEKRRRRKRGTFPDPNKRVFINERVCEGCGDCSVKSNCVAVQPVETAYGRKRQIDQSVCNKDYSCLKGFCPSFVTIEGGELIKGAGRAAPLPVFPVLKEPQPVSLERPWSVLITGIGGTGVVTIGHVLAMAAHIESKGAALIDMAGLSQKNGAVVTHLKFAKSPQDIGNIRIPAGGADLILGCDLVTSASDRVLSSADPARTSAVVNAHQIMPAQFTRNPDLRFPAEEMMKSIESRLRTQGAHFVDSTGIATELLGDSIASNMFTLGYAYQKELIPIGAAAIERAIELNGVSVKLNLDAFLMGRRAAQETQLFASLTAQTAEPRKETIDELVERRFHDLVAYQNEAYAKRYRSLVEESRRAESAVVKGTTALSEAVGRYYYKLLAYKDEYEVARLYTNGEFQKALARRFKGGKINVYLAPPILASRDPATGELRKRAYGPWVMSAFRLLARLKFLRGSFLDPFGHTAERRRERALISDYEQTVREVMGGLTPLNHALAVEIAEIPELIRGYGHVKDRHLGPAQKKWSELLEAYRAGKARLTALAAE